MSYRKVSVQSFVIPAGQTESNETRDIAAFVFGGIHINQAATIQFVEAGEWGEHEVLEIDCQPGWNPFDEFETRSIGAACKVRAVVDSAPGADLKFWLKMKS